MKKIIMVLFLLLIVILPSNVKALSVDKNNLTIKSSSNETIALYAEVEKEIKEVSFSLVYTSYDVPAYFNVEAGLSDQSSGIKHKITFSEPVTGKVRLGTVRINVVNNPKVTVGSVNVHSATALTTSGENMILSAQTINVNVDKTTEQVAPTVKTDEEEDTKTEETNLNLLEKIESEIVKIDIKEDVYEYTVKIKKDIEELDLKPITKDNKYKVEISSQKISELKDNQIIITVKDGDKTQEYKIKVNIIDDIEKVEIDEEVFESTYKYKGKWVTLIVILIGVLFVGVLLNKKK